jgi:hypothetical protein
MGISSAPFLADKAGRNAIELAGLCVTDAAYGAIDDGLGDYFAVTWTTNSATLEIASYIGTVTVANSGPNGVAVVTLPGDVNPLYEGWPPKQEWVGKPIAITGAGTSGATFVANVATFYYDSNNSSAATLQLDRSAPTTLSSSSQTVACPCFSDGTVSGVGSCIGKEIWLSQGGQANSVVTGNGNVNDPFYPLRTTISSFECERCVDRLLHHVGN